MGQTPPEVGLADAIDVLIERERDITAFYEARQASAEGNAAAAITGVFAYAALTATVATTKNTVDTTAAALLVGALVAVLVLALALRTRAGLQATKSAYLSVGSTEFDDAFKALQTCTPENAEPLEVRRRSLALCRARTKVAHDAAKSKLLAAAFASGMLTVLVLAGGVLAVVQIL